MYAAREIIMCETTPTNASDIYSYGASMFELFTEKYMWPLGNTLTKHAFFQQKQSLALAFRVMEAKCCHNHIYSVSPLFVFK